MFWPTMRAQEAHKMLHNNRQRDRLRDIQRDIQSERMLFCCIYSPILSLDRNLTIEHTINGKTKRLERNNAFHRWLNQWLIANEFSIKLLQLTIDAKTNAILACLPALSRAPAALDPTLAAQTPPKAFYYSTL